MARVPDLDTRADRTGGACCGECVWPGVIINRGEKAMGLMSPLGGHLHSGGCEKEKRVCVKSWRKGQPDRRGALPLAQTPSHLSLIAAPPAHTCGHHPGSGAQLTGVWSSEATVHKKRGQGG